MSRQKTKIHQFDPVIYPQKLWIAISKEGTELNEMFRHKSTGETIRFEEYGLNSKEALVFPVFRRETGDSGVLIVFTGKKYMSCKTIAHEAVHAAGYMFQHIGQEIDSEEAFAYLVGWVADCCRDVRQGLYERKNGKTE